MGEQQALACDQPRYKVPAAKAAGFLLQQQVLHKQNHHTVKTMLFLNRYNNGSNCLQLLNHCPPAFKNVK
jgi:hypothetical protein